MRTRSKTRRETSWKRFGAMFGITAAMAAGLVALTAEGVLAANFSISGMPFTVTATQLQGTGFEQFAALDTMIEDSPNAGDTGGQVVVIVSAIDKAELTKLCQSVSLGGMYLKITAGDNGTPVKADSLVVDSDQISGEADFKNIDIGQDASTFDKVNDRRNGGKITGGEGVFGQQADTVAIANLRQNNYATTAARFTLPHLRMAFTGDGC
ncbi:DUF6230 family protein [Paractinoplanes atraurantiacus]|uniref:Cholesterol esterase n=1 Tax=Paractinoplanes atraurantiacus TaxID=1036182 RepID=A0A285IIU9_9ACTN|nr:DUF6230 family protein [Actinoplanes atraurantiacus]SNY47006.1 hypothetical protein SAMN05421748_10852 [Actinoplanes atraurantiacus]